MFNDTHNMDLSTLQLAALIVSNVSFLLSVFVLRKLSFALFYTQSRTRDEAERIAFYCCVLYIINPASVFMSAMYVGMCNCLSLFFPPLCMHCALTTIYPCCFCFFCYDY